MGYLGEVDPLDRRYRLRGLLGEGSAGVVYEAENVRTRRVVALKVYHASLADEVRRGRWQREVELMQAIRHRRLVRILDWGPFGDSVALAMERLFGPTLGEFMTEIPTDWLVWLVVDAIEGLAVLHDHGVIHRDIKPDNILVRNDGSELEAVLLDLGIARPVQGGIRLTQPGTSLGTPTYMSPEQAMTAETTFASDIWAMGVILYRILSGRVPFAGKTPLETVLAARRDPPPPLTGVPRALAHLVLSCLDKEPGRRPSHGSVLYQELIRVLREEAVQDFLQSRGLVRATSDLDAPTLPDVVGGVRSPSGSY